ncbi:hypothetical protein [Fredinandcohnia sp. 179-A 10B2 NHS]|uniref:hypothetical protein n=1 Tax=Fredinandcohnia sp. 179-A 10B2 NHS TaxID=3235176 RepID=UPI0039A084A4
MKKLSVFVLLITLIATMVGCSTNEASAGESSSSGATGEIKMGRVNYAAHGDKSFAVAVVAMDGDTIVGASIDEFQFLDKSEAGVVPVPNSDGAFSEGYADANNPLASKVDSTEYYSKHMAEAAGATNTIEDNYAAIEKYVTGKTIKDIEEVLADHSPEEMVDVVSGATLADTYGYVKTFIEAAKATK